MVVEEDDDVEHEGDRRQSTGSVATSNHESRITNPQPPKSITNLATDDRRFLILVRRATA